jgi:hypothetical protein
VSACSARRSCLCSAGDIDSTPRPAYGHHLPSVGHIEAMAVGHRLPDGRTLFSDVSFLASAEALEQALDAFEGTVLG